MPSSARNPAKMLSESNTMNSFLMKIVIEFFTNIDFDS